MGTVVNDLLGPMPYRRSSSSSIRYGRPGANYFTSAFLDQPDEAVRRRDSTGGPDLPVQAELHIHHLGGAMAAGAGGHRLRPPHLAVHHQLHRPDAGARRPARAHGGAMAARDAGVPYGSEACT